MKSVIYFYLKQMEETFYQFNLPNTQYPPKPAKSLKNKDIIRISSAQYF